MRVVILAAGASRRLRACTQDRPKSLVPLAGRPLLERQLAVLERAGLRDVTIVTGYHAECLAPYGRPTRHNARFAETNMVTSLMAAADRLDGGDDVLVTYGDIVYEPRVLSAVLATDAPLATTVDRSWARLWAARGADPLTTAETLRLSADGAILELGKTPQALDDIQGQYMGIICANAATAAALVAEYDGLDPTGPYDGKDRDNMYMTSFLQHLIDAGRRLEAVFVDGGWLEIDEPADLEAYERLHHAGRLDDICNLSLAG